MGEGGGAADGSDKVEPQLRRHVRQARRQLSQDEETTRLSQGLHQVPTDLYTGGSVFRIRIETYADPDLAFYLYEDPDSDPREPNQSEPVQIHAYPDPDPSQNSPSQKVGF
jgi:hypothetical protein